MKKGFKYLGCLIFAFLTTPEVIQAEIKIDLPQSEAQLNSLLVELKNSALPQIEKIELCLRENNNVITEYSEIRKRYLTIESSPKPLAVTSVSRLVGNEYDLSVTRNFEYYLSTNTDFFKLIDDFINEESKLSAKSTLEDINNHYKSSDARLKVLGDRLYPLSQIETQFLSYLDGTKKALSRYLSKNKATLIWLAGEDCKNAAVREKLLLIQADASEFTQSVANLNDFSLALRMRRVNLVQRLQYISSQRVDQLWRSKFSQAANQTRDEIDGLLRTVRLGSELQEYWILVNMRGLGDGLHLKYLQYQAPLRILIAELGRLKAFEDRFLNLKSPGPEQGMYLGKIKNYRDLIQKEIQNLNTKGWRGQLDRQVLLNKKRLEKAVGPCKEKITEHLEAATKVAVASEFPKLELLYVEGIATCATK